MQVCDGENCCDLGLHDEEHAEWEPVENCSPELPEDERKTQRSFLDPCQRCVKFNEEFRPEALAPAVVPRRCFEGIEFSLGPNLQPRHLRTGAEAMPYSLDDLLPRSGFRRGSAMCRETLFQEGLLPLLERDLVDTRRDVIPERLHVIDLVFDRKRVEPRGRQRQGM